MYWNIENNNNLLIIEKFFKNLYQNNPQLYHIEEWSMNNKEYHIYWDHPFERMEKLEL